MEGPEHTVSSKDHIICPGCKVGRLPAKLDSFSVPQCDSCGLTFERAMVNTLKQIFALKEVLGEHACEECWHPEMRRLSDGTFVRPACRSEVLPGSVSDDHYGQPLRDDLTRDSVLGIPKASALRRLYLWLTITSGAGRRRVQPGVDLESQRRWPGI